MKKKMIRNEYITREDLLDLIGQSFFACLAGMSLSVAVFLYVVCIA